jgi:hypothetical protein
VPVETDIPKYCDQWITARFCFLFLIVDVRVISVPIVIDRPFNLRNNPNLDDGGKHRFRPQIPLEFLPLGPDSRFAAWYFLIDLLELSLSQNAKIRASPLPGGLRNGERPWLRFEVGQFAHPAPFKKFLSQFL